jgi:hypothetical protein
MGVLLVVAVVGMLWTFSKILGIIYSSGIMPENTRKMVKVGIVLSVVLLLATLHLAYTSCS